MPPLLGTRGVASARGFGMLSLTGIGGPYWLETMTDFNNGLATFYAVDLDSQNNVYALGASATDGMVIAKFNNSGVLQWQRACSGSSVNWTALEGGIKVASSGNIYASCRWQTSGGTQQGLALFKVNSSGTVQWCRTIENGSWFNDNGRLAIDSSESIYVVGTYKSGSALILAKYNSSGTIQWQRYFGPNTTSTTGGANVDVDSNGNIYCVGSRTATSNQMLLVKYNSSGVYQWHKLLGVSGVNNFAVGVSVAPDGSIYVAGLGNNRWGSLAKYDSSGTLQWQRWFGDGGNNYGYDRLRVKANSSGVYIIGATATNGNNSPFITFANYDTGGTIQWQRYFTSPQGAVPASAYATDIVLDVSSNFYWVSTGAPFVKPALIGKLPGDGTKTGSYASGTWVYTTSSRYTANANMTEPTNSDTSFTGTDPEYAMTLTSQTATMIGSLTTLP